MADDKKFGNNDFEDIYSSSEKDGYEDIYSDSEEEGRAVSSDKKGDDDFEDFFTGRDDKSDNEDFGNETPVPRHREINTSPEVKPYSYNYNRAANSRAKKVSDEHGFTDISSGKQPKEKASPTQRRQDNRYSHIDFTGALRRLCRSYIPSGKEAARRGQLLSASGKRIHRFFKARTFGFGTQHSPYRR